MKSSDFMRAIPEAIRSRLPTELQGFQWQARPWLVQLYYQEPRLHYEVWWLAGRYGKRLEIGLHLESRDPAENERLLAYFLSHLVELKATLGDGVEAEPWDRGWTKIYETVPLESFTPEYLARVVDRLAEFMRVMEPMIAKARGVEPM